MAHNLNEKPVADTLEISSQGMKAILDGIKGPIPMCNVMGFEVLVNDTLKEGQCVFSSNGRVVGVISNTGG